MTVVVARCADRVCKRNPEVDLGACQPRYCQLENRTHDSFPRCRLGYIVVEAATANSIN
jgi:hypothetical protein